MTRQRLARACLVIAALAVCWALVVLLTGGGVLYVGPVRIASRGPRNPLLLAVIGLLLAWAAGAPGRRTHTLVADYRWLVDRVSRRTPRIPSPAPLVAGLAAVIVTVVGLTQGAFVAGGSDSYGYVSQAHLWTIGSLRREPVLFRPLASEVNLEALTPLGYRPTVDGRTIGPTYSPGLPIVMAVFERLTGPRSVFWVVPIFGGVLVWATYLLGAWLYERTVGSVAAVLVAASPPVLVHVTAPPLSDLPAAAWWTLAFVMACSDRRAAALSAGACAGMAILTRPNLVPLLAVAAAFLVARAIATRRPVRHVWPRLLLFAVFSVPACLAIAALNNSLWGAAMKSGYGSLGELFSPANILPNVLLYPRVVATLIPVALLAPLAWFAQRDRTTTIALGSWAAAVVLPYISFFAHDSAWNLRFFIPAIPPLFVLATAAVLGLAGRVIDRHTVASVVVLLTVCGYGVHVARGQLAFANEHLHRYARIGDYISRELPQRAVLLAMLHSGSANYYSGRATVRWDLLAPSRLDPLVDVLRQRGYVPYLLIDSDERAAFQAHFRGQTRLAALDWPPLVTMHDPPVQIFSVPATRTPQPD